MLNGYMDQGFNQEQKPDKFIDILKPLTGENEIESGHFSLEYHYHLKLLQEFERRIRHVETLFRELYSRAEALEKDIKNYTAATHNL